MVSQGSVLFSVTEIFPDSLKVFGEGEWLGLCSVNL